MTDEPIYGATTTIYASDGGGVKWLLGAAAAAVTLGGGYVVAKNNAPSEDHMQIAAYDPYNGGEPLRATPLPPSPEMLAREAAAATERSAARAQTRRAPPARRAPPSGPAILEETIGVASASEDDDIVVTGARRPIWARTPNPRRLAALYPDRALERGREGEARLQCVIEEGGELDCARVSATPGGFGTAAMRVARRFRHAPQLADGSDAAGAQVNLRVVFRIEEEERGRG